MRQFVGKLPSEPFSWPPWPVWPVPHQLVSVQMCVEEQACRVSLVVKLHWMAESGKAKAQLAVFHLLVP